jgi:hypothetical protein
VGRYRLDFCRHLPHESLRSMGHEPLASLQQ